MQLLPDVQGKGDFCNSHKELLGFLWEKTASSGHLWAPRRKVAFSARTESPAPGKGTGRVRKSRCPGFVAVIPSSGSWEWFFSTPSKAWFKVVPINQRGKLGSLWEGPVGRAVLPQCHLLDHSQYPTPFPVSWTIPTQASLSSSQPHSLQHPGSSSHGRKAPRAVISPRKNLERGWEGNLHMVRRLFLTGDGQRLPKIIEYIRKIQNIFHKI